MEEPISNKLASPKMVKFRLMMGESPDCILTYIHPQILAKEAAKMLAEEVQKIKAVEHERTSN